MSDQGPKWFRRDFHLSLNQTSTGTASTLVDSQTGELLSSGTGNPCQPSQINALVQEASRSASAADSFRQIAALLSRIGLPPEVALKLEEYTRSDAVRLGLTFGSPELAALPWECMFWKPGSILPVGLHLYRLHTPAANQKQPGPITRALVVIADPQTHCYRPLANGQAEFQSVLGALNSPECRRMVVSELRFATPASLRRSIAEHRPDIIHFIGHGDVRASGGVLILESDRIGKEAYLYADELGRYASEAGTQLMVLSGCQTAGCLNAIGDAVVSAGVSAVVGMQLSIRDGSAHLFSRALYASLAEGTPLELAVSQGRLAISGTDIDWIAPILLTSTASSFALDVTGSPCLNSASRKHNIPDEERGFVGRAEQRESLAKLIQKPQTRLVTLTGMGGMGKTRLAKQVSIDLASSFKDGAWLVECESLTLEEEVRAAIAGALGLSSTALTEATLFEEVRDKNLLLLLDCFERISSLSSFISRLLRAAPGIKTLVTSRILLGLRAEREFSLEPMSLKKRRAQVAESLELFAEAATYAVPDFKIGRKNLKQIEALVEDLEAVPLAIVLAAGRLRHMSLEELANRVRSQRLDVLKRRPTGPQDRHADLLRVVGDSLSLLFHEDQLLVKSLSVFQGGFFQDDAIAVLGETAEVMDGISLLRDHSLLMSQLVDTRMRFRILDTIREYLNRIPDDETVKSIRVRHANHFAALADRIRDLFSVGKYSEARKQFSLDIGNYRVAVTWAIDTQDAPLIRRYAHSLARVYFETGATQEFDLLAASAEKIATEEDLSLLAELYGLQGELCRRNQETDRGIAIWMQRRGLFATLGNVDGEVDCLLDIARMALATDRLELAGEMLIEFDSLKPKLCNLVLMTTGIVLQAEHQMKRHGVLEALALCQEIEERMQSVAFDRQAFFIWDCLAQLYRDAGSLEDSLRVASRCLADGLESTHLMAAGHALVQLSKTCAAMGDVPRSARTLAIASVIPPNLFPALRVSAQNWRTEFVRKGHEAELRKALDTIGKSNWEILAWKEVQSQASNY